MATGLFFSFCFCFFSTKKKSSQFWQSLTFIIITWKLCNTQVTFSLSKNVNAHRCNRGRSQRILNDGEQQHKYIKFFNVFFFFCIFIFILSACAPFSHVYHTASFTCFYLHTVVYLLICFFCALIATKNWMGLHPCSHFYMYLWVLILVTEGHEWSHTEMFTKEVIVSLQLIILLCDLFCVFVNK